MEEKTQKKRVLMTYIESGMGHITSITSISDNLKDLCGEDYDIIDSYIMQEDNDKSLKNWEKFLIKQTKNTNKIRGFGSFVFAFLHMMGGVHFMRFIHRTVFRKYTNHCLEAFKKRKPDVIVSTHYFLTFVALEYKKKIDKNVKVITYNPDNNVHVWWDNREHLFVVNNEFAYYEAISKRKFNPALVKQVFFTARKDILDANLSKEQYRDKLNIAQDRFCAIVADGVYACGKSKKVTDELLKTDKEMTLIMLAGKNKKLYNYYNKLIEDNKVSKNINLIVLPFTKNIHEYYKAADIFVTKAGPNAILDSVFMGTPIIVDYYAHPIEKATTKLFIQELGVGKAIFKPKKVRRQIEKWIEDRTELDIFCQNTNKIDKNNNGGIECAKLIDCEAKRKELFLSKNDYDNLLYELAQEENFDTYTTKINYYKVKGEVDYSKFQKTNFFSKAYHLIIKGVLKLFGPLVNYIGFRIKVKGRKNLKGIKSGITISNHVHYLDCLWNMQAINKKKLYITGAPHNFKKGFFGATLKAGGFIPLTTSYSQTKIFGQYVSKILEQGGFVHFYPEQALWLRYEQSRPLKKGAFYYASKNNVPIIPIVICFRKTNFKKHKNVTINICKPIYPNPDLSIQENSQNLNERAQQAYDDTIIEFYNYDKETYAVNKVSKQPEFKEKISRKREKMVTIEEESENKAI